MKRLLLFLAITLCWCGNDAFGQTREKQVEGDGFVWFKITNGGKYGAEDTNGRTIIPTQYGFICYHNFTDGWFSVKDSNSHEGTYEKNGKCVISPNKGYSSVCKHKSNDGYWYTVKKGNKEGACDANGNEIIAPIYNSVFYSDIDHVFKYEKSNGDNVNASSSTSYASSSSSSSSYSSSSSSSTYSTNTSNGALHQGIYTHGSVGRSNTGDVMTIEKQLLNIEFYGDYIMINGSKANLLMEVDLPPNTKTVSLPAGRHVKIYQQVVEGLSVQYMVDANYNMEALWVKKNAFHYFFPIEKGNTLSTGGYSGGTYNNGVQTGGTGYYGGGYNSGNNSGGGSTPRQMITKTCGVCHGTGTCNICAGRGVVHVLGMGKDHYCTSCRNHDGRCPSCGGRGTWKE